ncbi:hypothetical protein ABPG77_011499 [Micractinium sp. CCAP 211/92]
MALWPLLMVAAAGTAVAQTIEPSAVVLAAQRNAIVNWAEYASANNILGWDAATPVCSWTAVVCDAAGAVTSIDLGCNSAGSIGGGSSQFCATKALGTLAPELAGLQSLASLSLNGQSFIGSLPPAWGSGGFPQLTTLLLSNNALTGSIPDSWATGGFASLTDMDLRGNPQLCGPVPPSLAPAPLTNISAGFGGRFDNPAYDGIPIDACLTFGRDCGKPAADYFCTLAGYPSALNFSDPVLLSPAGTIQVDTILPSEMSVCSSFFQLCQTFAWIQCSPA